MAIVECQNCGEDSELAGRRTAAGIQITCNRCGHRWMRDVDPSCRDCGSSDVVAFKEPLVQRARGNAYSIVGQKTIYLCASCDAPEIERRKWSPEAERPREDPWK